MPVATGSAILTNLIMMVTRIDNAASLAACQAAQAGSSSCSGVGTGSWQWQVRVNFSSLLRVQSANFEVMMQL